MVAVHLTVVQRDSGRLFIQFRNFILSNILITTIVSTSDSLSSKCSNNAIQQQIYTKPHNVKNQFLSFRLFLLLSSVGLT